MEIPLRFPPPGVLSNFSNPEFLGKPVLVIACICLSIVVLSASGRFYARAIVLRRWRLDDYLFSVSWTLGLAMVAFTLYLTFAIAHHAWDIDRYKMPKSSIIGLVAFWTAVGPLLWILKLTLFSMVYRAFGTVRWLKNCVWIGSIVTGLIFTAYTIIVTLGCGPKQNKQNTGAESFLSGLNRESCSSASGINALSSQITSVANGVSNAYLLLITYPLISSLPLERRAIRGVYGVFSMGVLTCLCSFIAAYYRIKSWRTDDITGNQIPFIITFIIEMSLSLTIPCLPSLWLIYRHYTMPDIDDTTTLATPNLKLSSAQSSPDMGSRNTWRKTHDLDELPFRKPSVEYHCGSRDSRMKALPTTPLPIATPKMTPAEPKSPSSFMSMRLPIMFHSSSHSS